MKLFQRLLVAPAALGLMAPLAANADITTISKDSDLNSEVIEARLDGVEAQLGEVMAGQFSETTTLSGKAAFVVGAVEDDTHTGTAVMDETTMNYMYQLNVNSSFTGEDNLYARIKTGNFGDGETFEDSSGGAYLSAANDNADKLEVDKLWYQFPVGDDLTVWVGPKIENYYMLASSPSIYKPVTKQFALGGNGSAYGSSTSPGFGAAWTQSVDDPSEARLGISANYTAKEGDHPDTGLGFGGDNGKSFFLTKLEWGTPQWQISGALAKKSAPTTATNGYDGYFHSAAAKATKGDLTAYGLRAYWKPDTTGAIPEVQLGYDFANYDQAVSGEADDTSGWMVGFGWKDLFMDGNRGGVAFGSRQAATSYKAASTTDPAEDNTVWEAYYTFKVNDGVSITPAVFGGQDVIADDKDISGALVLTEFRF